MSIELEVRSDDEYSRLAPRERVEALLRRQWPVESKSKDVLAYVANGCCVEITVGGSEPAGAPGNLVAWVGFRVPAGARLSSAQRSLEIARSLATDLDWRVFDPQSGTYVDASDLERSPSSGAGVYRLFTEARTAGWRQLVRRSARRLARQSVKATLLLVLYGFGGAVVLGWLFRFSHETRPGLFVVLTLSIALALATLGVVTDVLGEIHQEAVRVEGAAAEQGDEADEA